MKRSNDNLRVLYLDLGPGFGGSVVSLASLLKTGRERGLDTLVVMDHDDDASRALIGPLAGEVVITRPAPFQTRLHRTALGIRFRPLRWVMVLLDQAANIIYNIPFYWKVIRLARRRRTEVIHFNNFFIVHAGIIAVLLPGVRSLCHVRISFAPSWLIRVFAPRIDQFIAISGYVERLLRQAGVTPGRIRRIPDAIGFDEHRPSGPAAPLAGRPRVAVFGCLLPWKGQQVFIEAAARLLADASDLRSACFYIVGASPGPDRAYEQSLHNLTARLNLQERVFFLGHRSDVQGLMSAMDVVVHTSVEPEPLGRVIVEAMLLGRPVAATAMGGPLDYIEDGVNGFLVPPGDPDALARVLARILADASLCDRVGQQARQTAEREFSTANNEAILACYTKCRI